MIDIDENVEERQQSLKGHFRHITSDISDIIDAEIQKVLEEHCTGGDSEDERVWYALQRKEIIRAYDYHLTNYINDFKESHKKELRRANDYWPIDDLPKWMKDKLADRIDDTIFLKAISLMNYLWTCRVRDADETQAISERINAGMHIHETREGTKNSAYAFIGTVDYEHIHDHLGMGKSQVQAYMNELSRIGILKKFTGKKSGPHGQSYFAIGYFSLMQDGGMRANPFLKGSKEIIQGLRDFDPWRDQKKTQQ